VKQINPSEKDINYKFYRAKWDTSKPGLKIVPSDTVKRVDHVDFLGKLSALDNVKL